MGAGYSLAKFDRKLFDTLFSEQEDPNPILVYESTYDNKHHIQPD
jgi:hypothetical protein